MLLLTQHSSIYHIRWLLHATEKSWLGQMCVNFPTLSDTSHTFYNETNSTFPDAKMFSWKSFRTPWYLTTIQAVCMLVCAGTKWRILELSMKCISSSLFANQGTDIVIALHPKRWKLEITVKLITHEHNKVVWIQMFPVDFLRYLCSYTQAFAAYVANALYMLSSYENLLIFKPSYKLFKYSTKW